MIYPSLNTIADELNTSLFEKWGATINGTNEIVQLNNIANINDEKNDLQNKIVMTAWVAEREVEDDPRSEITKQEGKLAVCDTFDEGAFDDFKDDHIARGPELFALDDLMPGQG